MVITYAPYSVLGFNIAVKIIRVVTWHIAYSCYSRPCFLALAVTHIGEMQQLQEAPPRRLADHVINYWSKKNVK